MPTYKGHSYQWVGPCVNCGTTTGAYAIHLCDPCFDKMEAGLLKYEPKRMTDADAARRVLETGGDSDKFITEQ